MHIKCITNISTARYGKEENICLSMCHTGIKRGKNSLKFSGGNWASQYADLPSITENETDLTKKTTNTNENGGGRF